MERVAQRDYLTFTITDIKLIALVSMLIDHIGLILYPDAIALRIIGRLAFPLFAFCIAEGMAHTKDRVKYIRNVFLFAVISTPVYVVSVEKPYNVLWTFVYAMLCIIIIDYEQKKKKWYISIICFTVYMFILFFAEYTKTDYRSYGVLLVVLFYYYYSRKNKASKEMTMLLFVALTCWCYFGTVQMFCLFSIPILWFYNGQKGSVKSKWLFYSFYPLHLLILYVISRMF